MNIPEELKYTKDHEWVKIEGNIAVVGITEFAQGELGDLVYIEVDTLDEEVATEDVLGSIEAVKTVSDIFSPLSGKVVAFNEQLESAPEIVNQDPYGEGWILKIEFTDANEIDQLLPASEYQKLIGG